MANCTPNRFDELAQALLRPEATCPPGLSSWNGSDPAARFAIYRNNVLHSLVQCLSDTFPVTAALVGSDFFQGMATVFVRKHPPQSAQLVTYGSIFPNFIAQFAPAAALPYLADTARLEMARVHAYHAADAAPMPLPALQVALQTEAAARARWNLHPSLQTLQSAHAVVDIWQAHQTDGDVLPFETSRGQSAWIFRDSDAGNRVRVLHVLPAWCAFTQHLAHGATLPEAAEALPSGADFPQALAALIQHGLVIGCRPEPA